MELGKKQIKSILKIIFISIAFYFLLKEIRLVVSGIGYIWSVFSVFAFGGAMAFVFNVPMKFVEEKYLSSFKNVGKAKRPLAFLITLTLVLFVIYLVMFIVVPQLAATLQVLVWERGSGRTLACGTGACAAFAAAWKRGLCGGRVRVEMPGGELELEKNGDGVLLTGPARRVFEGEIFI